MILRYNTCTVQSSAGADQPEQLNFINVRYDLAPYSHPTARYRTVLSSLQQVHVALSFANFANVKSYRNILQCTAHRLQFLFFLKRFRSDFVSKSTNNSILLETGRSYHSTLFSSSVALVFYLLSSYITVPFRVHILLYLLTAQIQLCSCTDPGPSSTQRSHSYSGRFNPVCLS
jgi:hypothetical protein